MCNRVMQDLGEIEKVHFVQSQRIVHPPLLEGNIAVGFFYGASQNGGVRCGAGVILKCLVLGIFSIKMNYGYETNTRGKLMALWCILYFSHYKQVSCLQLVGDSKVIVDYFSFKNNLQVITLQPWMSRIHQLSENFQTLQIQHIYREFNKEIDHLSKQDLHLDEGFLFYAKGEGAHVEPFECLTIV